MPFNGSGTFTPHSPEYPVVAGTTIKASDWNTIVSDIATGLSNTLCRDGQSSPTANINWAGQKITNLQAGTAPSDAVNFAQMIGRLVGVQIISVTGVYTPTVGTNRVIVLLQGGGGAGGGTAATAAGQQAVGAGGGAGGWSMSFLIAGFSGVTITIGAGGIAVLGATGGNGGTTSFGALFSATGGSGGGAGAALSNTLTAFSQGSAGGTGVGGTILNTIGGIGGTGLYTPTAGVLSGEGGMSYFGQGGSTTTAPSNGINATARGSGGGGSAQAASGIALTGGGGVGGTAIIWEYS